MSLESGISVCPWCGLQREINRARDAGPCRNCFGRKEIKGPTDWMTRGACIGLDSDIFFDEARIRAREYVEHCRSCDVAHECAEFAFRNRETYGVWGGLTPDQRSHLHLKTTSTGGKS